MNITSRLKNWAEDGIMIGVAIIALAIIEYESFIAKRNENR
jgi:hypothetical protein